MKATHFTTALLSLTPVVSALAWPQWLPDIDNFVVRRADNAAATASTAAASATAAAAATNDAADATNLNTAGITATGTSDAASGTITGDASGTATGTGKDDSDKNSTSVSVSSGAGAGSAVILTPLTTMTSAYYRIGEFVTFGWNYTNLQVKPTAVDVVVSCTTVSETWTLTSNMTFETKGSFTWDTGAYQSSAVAQPLVVEEYILYIYDADSAISASAGPGSLTAAAAVTFGLYTGQPYTPMQSGWVCATCSGALSSNERQALGLLFTMAGITVISFTWFVTGLW
ncbi:hypothetical protein VMCG_00377 [Cytospora schulzeri]|uniref:DUF7137 domain-containing protein n=1 Tax=Cytospora schulzeri TaxID=448051 RepID=A0A423X9B4_9PEZI|nr:hypothetical protein VMCG_00377 [Valsa malicola]